MLAMIQSFLHKSRQWLKRSVWLAKLFKLNKSESDSDEPGLILIQIDGLARKQFQRALDNNKMPFLNRYMHDSNKSIASFYPGLPSSTPAVQGELHYGIPCAVPAFEFFNRKYKRHFKMYEADDAQIIEKQLAEESNSPGLLSGGASYSNVYQGGAAEAHYCAASIGIDDNIRKATPFWFLWFLILNPLSSIRTLVLTIVELFIAVFDFIKGTIRHGEFLAELKHIPTRIAICIGLREMVELNVRIDAIRGVPIIHANFLGYDEQAHRRGPDAGFAHWTLKGIDAAIRRIWKEASKSPQRNYDLWIFSDHGQASVSPYAKEHQTTINESIMRFLGISTEQANPQKNSSVLFQRAAYFRNKIFRNLANLKKNITDDNKIKFPCIVANGPITHVYLANDKAKDIDSDLPRKIIRELEVPVVLSTSSSGNASMWTQKGQFNLPDEYDDAFNSEPVPVAWLADDLVTLANHPDAGDYILLSTIPGAKNQITFPMENGSHGAASPDEIEGFAILPKSVEAVWSKTDKHNFIRPRDLRQMVIDYRNNKPDTYKHGQNQDA